jgi:chromosome segregation ATPase
MKYSLLLLLAGANALALSAGENPVRKIVNLLQNMQKKIEEEGEQQQEMFEKFMCYCDTNSGKLQKSVDDLTETVPQNEASVKSKTELKAQIEGELVTHKQDREDAQSTVQTSTEQRNKDKAAFDSYSAEAKSNIASIKKAVAALRKGLGASFLQTPEATLLQRLVLFNKASGNAVLSSFDQEEVSDFLQGKAQGSSNEIVGILEQMQENMEADLKESEESEASALADFGGLLAAKNKEIASATSAIEDKTARVGTLAVDIVNAKNDLSDTQDALAEDSNFLIELKTTCAEQAKLYDQIKKMRSEEISAVGATIKILNDDDALDLFKKTLPSPSLIQVTRSSKDIRDQALKVLGAKKDFGFIALALQGKKVGFEKVIKMVDEMVVTLGQEQKDDDTQRDWCNKEFDASDDKEKDLKRSIHGLETQISETADAIETLKGDLAALTQKIKDLDSMVAEATDTRKDEHALFVQTSAENNAALQLLEVAKNRLNKFYNPAVYKAPPKRELTEEERLYVASGGVLTTPAPGGIAGTGIAVFSQMKVRATMKDAPEPPPETVDAYQKSDSSGPLALIDRLKNDLAKDQQAIEMEEKTAQKDYEELRADSAATRAQDSTTITETEAQKAGLEGDLEAAKEAKANANTELSGTQEYIAQLHGSCDFLLQNYDLRKEARANEVDALKKAKAVLSGADYSFLQHAYGK